MKTSLMATVAAVALVAGPQLALAQKQEAPASKVESPARAPAAQQNAPAEKMAPAVGTTGQASPGSDKAGSKVEMKSDTKSDMKADPKGGARTGASTDTKSGTASDTKSGTKAGTAADTKSGSKAGSTASDTKSDAQTRGAAADSKSGASVQLSSEQRTRIRTTVLTSSSAPRVTSVNFSVSVGTVVPRNVRVVALPATLVEIQPSWRGYMYFVYQDEIIVVEPDTLRIVAVLNV